MIWIQQHSMLYLMAKENVLPDEEVYRIKTRIARRRGAALDREAHVRLMDGVAARYRANVEAIADRLAGRGIALVLMRQPMTTRTDNRRPNERTYEEEHAVVKGRFERGEFLNQFQRQLLGHRRLIATLDSIAAERGLPVVDNIAIVDRDRNLLSSWVHLTEEANGLLAAAMKEAIDPYVQAAARRGGQR